MAVAVDSFPSVGEGRAPLLRRIAVVLAVVAVLEAAGIIGLGSGSDPRFVVDLGFISIGFTGTVVLFPVMGALIIQRRPYTKVAWLMIALGLGIGFGLVTYAYGVVGMPVGRPALPFAIPALVLSQLFFVPSIGTVTTWILLLFPTDELLSPRWRWVALVGFVAATAYVAGTIFRPGEFDSEALPGVLNPLGTTGQLGEIAGRLADVANLVGAGALVLSAISLVLRYRRADPIVAAQLRWLALVAVAAVALLGASLFPLGGVDDLVFGLGLVLTACMPIAIGIAITRYRLYEIDRLINRTLVYGSLTAILAGVFTAGVGLAQRVFVAVTHETSDAAVVGATLVVATLYAPLRKRLEAVVDRYYKYEERRFGAYRDELARLLSVTDPRRAAWRLISEAVRSLPATGGATFDAAGAVSATAGLWPVEPQTRIRIPDGTGVLTSLVVGPRPDGAPHDPVALAALEEVAGLATAAAAARTTAATGAAGARAVGVPRTQA